jgi:ABC-type glycerol-3-phosphate transport system substrate-binding protein
MRAKVTALVMAACIGVFGSVFCIASTSKLSIYSNFPQGTVEFDDFQRYLRQYESANPGANIEDLGRLSSADKLVTMFAAGVAPDLFAFTTHNVFSIYEQGYLADMPRELTTMTAASLLPVTIEANSLRGKIIGLPFGNNVTSLFYNMRLLRGVGLDPKPPETWSALEAMGRKATTAEHAGLVTSGDAWSLTRIGTAMLWSFGGDVVDEDGKITLDSASFRQVLDNFVEWFRPGSLGVYGYSRTFNEGKAALQLGFPAQLSSLRQGNPLYMEETAAARVPAGPAGAKANHYGHTYAVSRGPQEKEAWRLLEWLFFSTEGPRGMTPMGDVCLQRGYPPFHKRDIAAGLTLHPDAPFYRAFVDNLLVARNYENWWEQGFTVPLIGQGIRDAVKGKPSSHVIAEIVQDIEKQKAESK